MPSIKDLKKRIASTKNTQQTTKAMKMVSAAKLRRAQDAIQNNRPYAQGILRLIRLVASVSENLQSPLLASSSGAETEGALKRAVLVVVTSDRGLCGGFNSNVLKTAQRWMAQNKQKYSRIDLVCVGRKGNEFFKSRKANIISYDPNLGGKVTVEKAKTLSDQLIQLYLGGDVQEVKVIYTEFKNAVSQIVRTDTFLPLVPGQESAAPEMDSANYIVKPSTQELFQSLLEKNFTTQAFRILLESQASEHGARMSAMENATKNAGEMIRKLTLQFNKQRQAGITKELLEIIAGSESQKGSA